MNNQKKASISSHSNFCEDVSKDKLNQSLINVFQNILLKDEKNVM